MTRIIINGNETTLDSRLKWDVLSPHLRKYGKGAFSYATLQDGMKYFLDETGYIAFVSLHHPVFAPFGRSIILGDPICSHKDNKLLIGKFLENYPRAVFVPISEECGNDLHDLGFKVNCVGYESEIPIQDYNTTGDWKELDLIRRARNEAKRNNVVITEGISNVSKESLESISKKWLQGKKLNDREIWIYARPPVFDEEKDVRKFIASKDGEVVGFVFYDPLYQNGKITGYSTNISRCDESRFGKLSVAVNMEAVDKFKEEGKDILNLCLAPFDKVEQGKMNDDLLTKLFFKFMYCYGDNVYNFRGLSFHKSKYRANEKPVYFASNGLMPVNDVYLAFKSSKIANSYPETLWKVIKYFLPKN